MSEPDNSAKRQEQLQARRKMLSAEQQAMLERRLRGGSAQGGAAVTLPPLVRVARDQELPLSFFQEYETRRFLPPAQNESSPISKCFRLQGAFNKEAFEQSINALAARHEILRTNFPSINGRFVHVIAPTLTVKLPFKSVRHLPEAERLPEALRLISEEAFRPYDLAHDPLWRSLLVEIGPDDHALLLTMDHFISDAWSMDLMVRDTWVAYGAYASGSRPRLAELSIHYADFAHWQRSVLQGETLEKMIAYWMRRLDGMGLKPVVHFPGEIPLPPVLPWEDQEFADLEIEISEALTNSLRELSQEKNVTTFILTLTAVVLLLYRYTGKNDIGLCSPVANRDFPATKEVIGWFANMLVLRFDLTGVETFTELLENVRTVVLEAYEQHEVPYAVLYHTSVAPDHPSAPCLRFNMLAETKSPSQAQDIPLAESPFSRLAVTPLGIPRPSPLTKQPGIALDLGMYKGGLAAVAFYEIKRYPVPLVEEILKNYHSILEQLVAHPEKRLLDFAFVVGSS